MNFVLVALVLALVWAAITGSLNLPNLLLGALISVAALWIVRDQVQNPKFLRRLRRIMALAWLFFYELVLSALRVALLVISPNMKEKLKPGIVAMPLSVKSDAEIALLANLITLTPGTLSLDVSEDRKILYVHALDVPDKDALIRSLKSGFETKVKEAFE